MPSSAPPGSASGTPKRLWSSHPAVVTRAATATRLGELSAQSMSFRRCVVCGCDSVEGVRRISAPVLTKSVGVDVRSKTCARCGRSFDWRKKWAACWDEVRFCSQKCRRSKPSAVDVRLEQAIRQLLERRAAGGTICPSEAARAVADDWRPLLERTRMAARRLAAQGEVEITQGGRVVDPDTARGAVRVRRCR